MARPRTYRTQGIVLKHMPLGEADRIVTLITPDLGKLRAVARGVRRPRSKMGGHLEPLTHVKVSVARGRGLDYISEAEIARSFRTVKEDLGLVSRSVYLAELVESFTAEGTDGATEFRLLLDALGWMERTDSPPQLTRYFEVQLLRQAGFGPELRECVQCGSDLEPVDHLFSPSKGGIVCPQCRHQEAEPLVHASMNATKVLRYFQEASFAKALALALSPALLDELARLLRAYIRFVLDREVKSADFMKLVASERRGAAT